MNKLTLSALIASTLFISACDQAQDTTEGAMDKAAEMTYNAAEHSEDAAEAGKEMVGDAMEAGKDMASDAMEAGKDMANSAMEKMDTYTGLGSHDGRTGYPVGQEKDINALREQYHAKMEAL